MAESGKPGMRLSKAAKEFNIGISTILEYLAKKGFHVEKDPNTKLLAEMVDLLEREFHLQKSVKEEANKKGVDLGGHKTISIEDKPVSHVKPEFEDDTEELSIKTSTISKIAKEPEIEKTALKKANEEIIKPLAEKQKEESKVSGTKEEKGTITAEESEKKKESKTVTKSAEKEQQISASSEQTEIADDKAQEEKSGKQLKVIGKIDLTTINPRTKPKPKTAEEKKKERAEKSKEKKSSGKKTGEVELPVEEVITENIPAEVIEIPPVIPEVKAEETKPEDPNFIKTRFEKLEGPKILDKIELPVEKKRTDKKPVASSKDPDMLSRRKKRKRIKKKGDQPEQPQDKEKRPQTGEAPKPFQSKFKDKRNRKERERPEISEDDIQQQIKETLAKLTGVGKSKASKYRREKRQNISQLKQKELEKIEDEKNVIKVTEFVTANELASLMNVQVNQIISTCMTLGLFVSINQRLDAETLTLVAEEFGFTVEFVSADFQETINESVEEDKPEDLIPRAPIVTVMGHVDHGKTKLLDFIRKANVVDGEAGGITQHIGAYEFITDTGKRITFLDTPGHEAFTAMRARGAKVTDVAIIVVAADDSVMPQTVEAINHAQAAGVPIVFAINKIDKPGANPEKIKEELSKMNILVEDWGGKFQSQEISAKQGINIDILVDKVLLEAEMLDLKANPDKLASGTVMESSLDKGRGYVAKLLVQEGTLNSGDVVLAGATYGKVKAMYNERNQRISSAGPSTPLLLLGLNGAPQAGDVFKVLKDEREAKAIATKRQQLQREQGIRTQKHITLDEIGRRIAIGDFKELNIIVKGDVDGSVEALSDSLLKLSNEQIQVNIIHKSVGAVTETDVMLASASDAVIVAFQVRPSVGARKLAEQEQIDIRLYSIIYQAIEEIKSAMEGMLSPDIEEKITCNVEVREVFKISKVGTVAGCMVLDGTITRHTRVRIIREGIVVYTGNLGSLKRFKDDVKEVKSGYECGLNIENYNDIKVGDILEGYEEVEVKKKL